MQQVNEKLAHDLRNDAAETGEPAASPGARGVPRSLVICALLIAVVWGITEARSFLVPLSISALLAFLLSPLVRVLRRMYIPEWLAIVVSAVALLLPLLALGYLLFAQAQALSHDFPVIIRRVNAALADLAASSFGQRINLSQHLKLDNVTARLATGAGEGLQLLLSGLGAVLSAGSEVALVLLYTILMVASRVHLRLSAERILERNRSILASAMLDEMTVLIERFLIARFLIVLIVGAVDFGILSLFGLNYAPLLASLLGVMTLVPAIGFIIAVIPAIAVALAMHHGLGSLLVMLACLFAMSVCEGNVLTPKLVGKRINLNALTVFVALFAGSLIWGLWGMLLAIPLLGVIRIAFMASPRLQPWGELLADRPSDGLSRKLMRGRAGHA